MKESYSLAPLTSTQHFPFSLVAYWWNASSSQHTSMWTFSMMAPRRFCQHFTTLMNLTMTRGLGYWNLTQLSVSYSKATWQSKERFPWKQHRYQCWSRLVLGEQPRMALILYYQVQDLFDNLVYSSVFTCKCCCHFQWNPVTPLYILIMTLSLVHLPLKNLPTARGELSGVDSRCPSLASVRCWDNIFSHLYMVTATNGKPVDHVKCATVSQLYLARKCFLRLAVRCCFSLFQAFSCVAARKMAHEKNNTGLQRPKALLAPSISFLFLLRHFPPKASQPN